MRMISSRTNGEASANESFQRHSQGRVRRDRTVNSAALRAPGGTRKHVRRRLCWEVFPHLETEVEVERIWGKGCGWRREQRLANAWGDWHDQEKLEC
jgi:hypothetical protein